jgi:glutamate-1-semialdehyde aminotransferase
VRRIQEITSLSREDAVILAYGTFSTTSSQTFLGVDTIATTDQKLTLEIKAQREKLESKLNAIIQNLSSPWNRGKLPEIITLKE